MTVIIIDAQDRRHPAKVADSHDYVTIYACPACRHPTPQIHGTGISHHDRDTYYGPAVAGCCGAKLRMATTVDAERTGATP